MRLKTLGNSAIPAAIEKAKHYRLLNDPFDAESICRDILEIEPDHQEALKVLILAITDTLVGGSQRVREARGYLERLTSEFDRHYLLGLILERVGKSYLSQTTAESAIAAYDRLSQAMQQFEMAQACHDGDHDDAVLRWNSCARLIEFHNLHPSSVEQNITYGD
jgi:hypothetical protein